MFDNIAIISWMTTLGLIVLIWIFSLALSAVCFSGRKASVFIFASIICATACFQGLAIIHTYYDVQLATAKITAEPPSEIGGACALLYNQCMMVE